MTRRGAGQGRAGQVRDALIRLRDCLGVTA